MAQKYNSSLITSSTLSLPNAGVEEKIIISYIMFQVQYNKKCTNSNFLILTLQKKKLSFLCSKRSGKLVKFFPEKPVELPFLVQ